MGMALGNALIGMNGGQRQNVQKVAPARPSIAEDAKFVPKPHKRVSFKINNKPQVMQPKGMAGERKPIPLPGQKEEGLGASGGKISMGTLGIHGLTAKFTSARYQGKPEHQMVKMEIDYTPEKDYTVIQAQEEGRQTNNTLANTHHTQQYDAYGRPRIGFSREPYDFAATKYIAKTSQLKFEQNMQNTQSAFNSYSLNQTAGIDDYKTEDVKIFGAENAVKSGMVDTGSKEPELFGSDITPKPGMISTDMEDMKILGAGKERMPGMVDPGKEAKSMSDRFAADKPQIEPVEKRTGQSIIEVAEKMGMAIKNVLTSHNLDEVVQAHDLQELAEKGVVSVAV